MASSPQEGARSQRKNGSLPAPTPGRPQLSLSAVEHWFAHQAGGDCFPSPGGSDANLLRATPSDSRWASSPLAPVLLPLSSSSVQRRELAELRRPRSSPELERPGSQKASDNRPGALDLKSEASPLSTGLSRPASCGGLTSEAIERQHIGLSDATRRENQKKEQYELQLDQAAHMGSDKYRGRALDPLANLSDVAEALGLVKPEEFIQETSNLDHRIEDISRNVRLDHLADAKNEEKDRQKREEARKQKEAELRRARKREQEARNPQRKVALRLENKRRFETEETQDNKDIPMMRIEVSGSTHTTVSLVDVRMLRSRCKMLDEGNNVREMLEKDRRKEMEDKMTQDRLSRGLRGAASAPEMLHPGLLPDNLNYEQRLQMIRARNESQRVEEIIRKLSHCRNKLPYKLPYRFDVKKSPTGAARPRLTIAPPMAGNSGREAQVASALASKFANGQQGSCHGGSESAEMQKLMGELGRVVVVQEEAKKYNRRTTLMRSMEDSRRAVAARARLRRRWAAARAAAKVLMLHFQVVRRQGAVELVKSILRQLGEWARVRRSIKQLMTTLKGIQVTCRRYQDYKRQRCEELQRQWLRIEDHHLSTYFRMCSQKAVKEMKDQEAKQVLKGDRRMSLLAPAKQDKRISSKIPLQTAAKKGEFIQMIEDGLEKGNLAMDWKAYRIPQKDRWAIINAFYLNRLKKHVRSKGCFLAAVKARVDNEREMVHFLKTFGADDTAVRDFQQSVINQAAEVTPPAFWHLSEDVALRMIALAAQSMVNEKPFQDHPANKDLPNDLSKSRLVIPSDPESVGSGRAAALRASALLKRLDRPEWTVSIGRLRWRPQKKDQRPEPIEAEEEVEEGGKMSIEEVFSRFTPRLREIADGQAVKGRSSVRKEAPDV